MEGQEKIESQRGIKEGCFYLFAHSCGETFLQRMKQFYVLLLSDISPWPSLVNQLPVSVSRI